VLSGHKLGGRFALVRTKRGEGNEWLLIKKEDTHARSEGDITLDATYSVLSGLSVEELPQKSALGAAVAAKAQALGATLRELSLPFEPMLCADEGARLDDPERIYELKLDGVRILANKRKNKVTLSYRNGRVCTHSYPEIVRALETIRAMTWSSTARSSPSTSRAGHAFSAWGREFRRARRSTWRAS
jgi:bifunctional non-homologous end joining protein LigD